MSNPSFLWYHSFVTWEMTLLKPITIAKYDIDGIKEKEHAITLTLTLGLRDTISLSHETSSWYPIIVILLKSQARSKIRGWWRGPKFYIKEKTICHYTKSNSKPNHSFAWYHSIVIWQITLLKPIMFAKYDIDGIKQKEHDITLTLTLDSRDIISLSHEKFTD